MSRNPGRLIALGTGAVALIVVAAAVMYLLLPPRRTVVVAVPADDATPERVVTAYLDALNAHDCRTAQALTTAAARDQASLWCGNVAALTHVHVSHPFDEPHADSGQSGSEEEVEVPVTFDLKWRPFHDDHSMNEGPTTWGYRLTRSSSRSPWRIFDQGTG